MLAWFKKLAIWQKALVVSASPIALLLALAIPLAILEKAGVIDRPKTDESNAVAQKDPGWKEGYLAGFEAARKGQKKPDKETLNAAARRLATEFQTPEAGRGIWIANFQDAFWIGWGKGN